MPVEIKELVIQAKMSGDNSGQNDAPSIEVISKDNQTDNCASPADQHELLIEKCLERVQEWLREEQLR